MDCRQSWSSGELKWEEAPGKHYLGQGLGPLKHKLLGCKPPSALFWVNIENEVEEEEEAGKRVPGPQEGAANSSNTGHTKQNLFVPE